MPRRIWYEGLAYEITVMERANEPWPLVGRNPYLVELRREEDDAIVFSTEVKNRRALFELLGQLAANPEVFLMEELL